MRSILAAVIGLVGLSLVAVDADARRFSGGRNLGMQRSAPAQQQAAPKVARSNSRPLPPRRRSSRLARRSGSVLWPGSPSAQGLPRCSSTTARPGCLQACY